MTTAVWVNECTQPANLLDWIKSSVSQYFKEATIKLSGGFFSGPEYLFSHVIWPEKFWEYKIRTN